MKRRIISGLLCLGLVFSLTACGGQPPVETVSETAMETTETAAQISETTEETTFPTETVTEPRPVIELDAESLTFAHKGEEAVIYSGKISPKEIFWSSDDVSVAVAYLGTVYATGSGETTIRGTYQGQEVSCRVVSNADPQEPMPYIVPAALRSPQRQIPDMADAGDYFDDVIFMGDSTSYALYKWSMQNQEFEKSTFLVRGSVSIHSLISGQKKYFHQGKEKRVEDAIFDDGKGKLFMMLGINDVGRIGAEETMKLLEELMDIILEKNPELDVYLESITPIRAKDQGGCMTNDEFDRYNQMVKAYAEENGHHYVEIAPYFKDNENAMVGSYAYDNVHANETGLDLWVRVLKQYAAAQMEGETK